MNKQIKILSVIFLLLIVIVLIIFGNDRGSAKIDDNVFFNFDQDQVVSFQVNYFTTGLVFKKDSGVWQVKRVRNKLVKELEKKAGHPIGEVDKEFKNANSTEVAKSLTYLVTLKNLEPVSTESKKHATFEINDYSLHAIFFDQDGNELDRVYVGKTGPDPFTSFIRKKDSQNVYLANQDFNALLLRKYEEWLAQEKIAK